MERSYVIADMHAHVLPRIDDGSGSSEESLSMLEALYMQGVDKVVAAPHFYAAKNDPEDFFVNRAKSTERLCERMADNARASESVKYPNVYVGAEVAYFSAMSSYSQLSKMCIDGTDILLVEMPFDRWSRRVVDELCSLKENIGIVPMIAHIDRYFSCFEYSMLDQFKKNGVIIQCNTDSVLKLLVRKKTLSLFEGGYIDVLGTDCHNMKTRVPNMIDALEMIEKKVGADTIDAIVKKGNELLKNAKPLDVQCRCFSDEK